MLLWSILGCLMVNSCFKFPILWNITMELTSTTYHVVGGCTLASCATILSFPWCEVISIYKFPFRRVLAVFQITLTHELFQQMCTLWVKTMLLFCFSSQNCRKHIYLAYHHNYPPHSVFPLPLYCMGPANNRAI